MVDFWINNAYIDIYTTFWFDTPYEAQPGQTVVAAATVPTGFLQPEAEKLEISFRVGLNLEKNDYEILSDRITYEASVFEYGHPVGDTFVTFFNQENITVSVGTYKRSEYSEKDLCLWIRNDTDEVLTVKVSDVAIDGRTIIDAKEADFEGKYYSYQPIKVPHHSQVLDTLTHGGCGTPEMHGGIKEVYILNSLQLGERWLINSAEGYDGTVRFP